MIKKRKTLHDGSKNCQVLFERWNLNARVTEKSSFFFYQVIFVHLYFWTCCDSSNFFRVIKICDEMRQFIIFLYWCKLANGESNFTEQMNVMSHNLFWTQLISTKLSATQFSYESLYDLRNMRPSSFFIKWLVQYS